MTIEEFDKYRNLQGKRICITTKEGDDFCGELISIRVSSVTGAINIVLKMSRIEMIIPIILIQKIEEK